MLGCVFTVCPEQETAHSCSLSGAKQAVITAPLLSSLCLLEGEIFAVILFLELKCFFSLSSKSEESQSQNSINYLLLAAIFLSNPVQTLRKCLLTEDLY